MGQVLGGNVIVRFAPPDHDPYAMHYDYDKGVATIDAGRDVLNRGSEIGNIVRDGTIETTGLFAHEFTHILAQKLLVCREIEDSYCLNVSGYFAYRRWNPYYKNANMPGMSGMCPTGRDNKALHEALANTVGFYIATSGQGHVRNQPPVAFGWVEGYFRDRVIGR
jgi:hypothetical protein